MSSWPLVRLGDICDKITDGTHHSPANHASGDFKYITAKNIKPWGLDLSDVTYIDAQTHREIYSRCDVKKDDILYVKDGVNTGRVAVNSLEEEFSLLSSVAVLRAGPAIRPKYLAYALQESQTLDRMLADMAGVAITRLTLRKLNDAEIPLAPLACQDHIVEKLEELLSDLDAGVAELKAAQRKLAQYRQSLLKAAVEGALTADWRAAQYNYDHPSQSSSPRLSTAERLVKRGSTGLAYQGVMDSRFRGNDGQSETGADLLQRILTERRTRWETRQLAKFAEQGKTPPKGWQTKYPEPVAHDSSDLPALPGGWTWASVDQCALDEASITDGPFGSNLKSAHYTESGPRVLRLQNIGDGHFVDAKAHISEDHYETLAKHAVAANDVVVAMLGEVLPRACIIPEGIAPAIVKADCARIRLNPKLLLPALLNAVLNAEPTRKRVARLVKGIGRPRVNLGTLRSIPIPLPPIAEQTAICDALKVAIDSADEQEESLRQGFRLVAAQRKNILKAAFAGQLVPQDPNDEPASVLQERIRVERIANDGSRKPSSRRRGTKP